MTKSVFELKQCLPEHYDKCDIFFITEDGVKHSIEYVEFDYSRVDGAGVEVNIHTNPADDAADDENPYYEDAAIQSERVNDTSAYADDASLKEALNNAFSQDEDHEMERYS